MQNTTQTIKSSVKTIVRASHAPKSLRARAARDAFVACRRAMDLYLIGYHQLILESHFQNRVAGDAYDRLSKMASDINWQASCCDYYVPRGERMFSHI